MEAYAIPYLAADVIAVLDHLGVERAHVVGHDWGAALAWAFASLVPDRVERAVALSVGHPSSFVAAGIEQREKSWYMLLFQFEGIAERWLSDNGWENLRTWGRHPDIDGVIADLEADGSLTPALNYYRANVPPQVLVEPPLVLPPVQADTMGVWSSGDFALTERQMTGSDQFVSGPVALRAHRGPRALDAARGPRRRERAAGRLPAPLTGAPARPGGGVSPGRSGSRRSRRARTASSKFSVVSRT